MMFNLDDVIQATESLEGFCITCGEPCEGCEPDARQYHCEVCETPTVYGAEEIIIMGLAE